MVDSDTTVVAEQIEFVAFETFVADDACCEVGPFMVQITVSVGHQECAWCSCLVAALRVEYSATVVPEAT